MSDKNKDGYIIMIILFILSMIIFSALYFIHNLYVSYRLENVMQRYASPLENIIIAKEEYYTNVILTEIENNKFITNNIILKSSSIEDLEKSFEKAIDTHTKSLQVSMGEVVKTSSDTLNFWFAFISVIMIVFSFAGAFVNNNILKEAKEQLAQVEKESEKSLEAIEVETQKLIEQNEKNIKINNLFNLAYQEAQNEDYASSMDYYKQILEIDPQNSIAYYGIGLYEYYLNEFEKSVEYFDKAIEYNNNYTDAYFNRGLSKDRLNRYNEAIEDYKYLINLKPKHIKAYRNIAMVKNKQAEIYMSKNNLDNAYSLLNDALIYINKAIEIDIMEEDKHSKNILKRILDFNLYSQRYLVRIDINLNIMKIEIRNNNITNLNKLYDEIIEDQNTAIKISPKNLKTNNSIANIKFQLYKIYREIGDIEKSKELLNSSMQYYIKSIELEPNKVNTYNKIGFRKTKLANIEFKEKNHNEGLELLKEAIEYYNKGIKIDSNNSEIYDSRGYTRTKIANFERNNNNIDNAVKLYKECIEDFNKAIELNNKHALSYNSLGYIKNMLANIQIDKIPEESYNKLKNEALDNFNSAYKFANEDLKTEMIKYLSKLAKNDDKIAKYFFKMNDINF